MDAIKANIGQGDNLANLKQWQDLFGELARGYIDPSEPRKLAPGQGWGAGTGKLLHKYFFDAPVSALKAAGNLFDRGMKDPLNVPPLDYTASTVDALFSSVPGGGTGVANIGKRDALRNLGRSGVRLAKEARNRTLNDPMIQGIDDIVETTHRLYRRRIARAKDALRVVNSLPQKELDRIDDIFWHKGFGSEYGSYTPGTREIKLTDNLSRAAMIKETADTLFHEMTHARQWTPDKSLSEMVKARALRKASEDMSYRIKPIEQLARWTAKAATEGDVPFDQAYKEILDVYLRDAKFYNKLSPSYNVDVPAQRQWSKLAPHLREGLELAKKIPLAKKKIKQLQAVADTARDTYTRIADKPGATNKKFELMVRAKKIIGDANKKQIPYYQILQEFGIE